MLLPKSHFARFTLYLLINILVAIFISLSIFAIFRPILNDQQFEQLWWFDIHDGILIPVFWRLFPFQIILLSFVVRFRKWLWLHAINFWLMTISLLALMSQASGWCWWRLPFADRYGGIKGLWGRTGTEYVPEPYLGFLYALACLVIIELLYIYYTHVFIAEEKEVAVKKAVKA